ncbi:Nucleoid occlusion factor SlmA [Acinetobacter venetianus]|uniref:Nucleoid occlusion factor SlmA n=1 Tax=Acinetobacter venetianus TaxID=52133 RepID=A0A150HW30_9GAMM|nr:TetR/AcrR family transcriptional regulator [Acinetobacter venetianus]KXZ71205.1 Nucleoid occlusion factor SlmA [Acinetobacter venetianus]
MKNTLIKTSRRGRPPRTEDQILASRNLIIQVARELFATHGYEGVSMRKIAMKANCLPATLYSLFPSKSDLLYQILEFINIELTLRLENCYNNSHELKRLENLCYIQLDFWLERPGDCKAIFLIEDVYFKYEENIFFNKSSFFQLDIYMLAIQEAQSRGDVKAGDPEEIKNIIICTIFGIALSLISISKYHLDDPKITGEKTIRSLINGLK